MSPIYGRSNTLFIVHHISVKVNIIHSMFFKLYLLFFVNITKTGNLNCLSKIIKSVKTPA